MVKTKSPFLIAFVAVALVHLVLVTADIAPWDSVSKCFLAPLLIAIVFESRGPRILAAALAFCFLGDLLLEFDGWFTAGMAAFAAAHICFIVFFVQRGSLTTLKTRWWLPAFLIVTGAGFIAWAWTGLEPNLQPLVPVYALLLIGTTTTAIVYDFLAGLGALAFLVADCVILLDEAGRLVEGSALVRFIIMALYISAIYVLTIGILNRESRTRASVR